MMLIIQVSREEDLLKAQEYAEAFNPNSKAFFFVKQEGWRIGFLIGSKIVWIKD